MFFSKDDSTIISASRYTAENTPIQPTHLLLKNELTNGLGAELTQCGVNKMNDILQTQRNAFDCNKLWILTHVSLPITQVRIFSDKHIYESPGLHILSVSVTVYKNTVHVNILRCCEISKARDW